MYFELKLGENTPCRAEILHHLSEHKAGLLGYYPVEEFTIYIQDQNGNMVGGLVGKMVLFRLSISACWVDKMERFKGLGTSLLQKAEGLAKEKGMKLSWLKAIEPDTLSFYKKNGYVLFSELPFYHLNDHEELITYTEYYLKKKL